MAYAKSRKRYRIKYKNVAILLAILLIIILLISRGCSALFSKKDKPSPNNTLASEDSEEADPNDLTSQMTTDPTLQTSYYFQSVKVTDADLGVGDLVLVNNNIKFLGSVSEDSLDVVREKKNQAYSVSNYTVKVQPHVMEALNRMLLDFYNATGNDGVMVRAGFRTLEYQQELYDEELASTGQDYSTLVALPGYSEHHTGLAVDFTTYLNNVYKDFDGTGDYEWIMENCYKYGFVNRYPSGKESLTLIDNEPWHFRYVGVAHATAMHNLDYCLEEYIDYLKNYTILNGLFMITTDDGSQYISYYTPKSNGDYTDIFLPEINHETKELYPYEISGNNVDGWIVTFLYKEGNGVIAPTAPETEPEVTTAPEDGGNAQEADNNEEE